MDVSELYDSGGTTGCCCGIGAVLADQVSNCGVNTFQYNAGAGERYGLVVIRITITANDGSNEQVSLLQQVHVLNAP